MSQKSQENHTRAEPTSPQPTEELYGDLLVTAWSEKKTAQRLSPDSPKVTTGELVRLNVYLSAPAHVYLLWVNSKGEIQPLHPWNPDRGFDAPPATAGALRQFASPDDAARGWEIDGPPGRETFILLARRTPLEPTVDLKQLLGTWPAEAPPRTPTFDWLALVESGWYRIDPGKPMAPTRLRGPSAKAITDPIVTRLSPLQRHFELIQAVRITHMEKE